MLPNIIVKKKLEKFETVPLNDEDVEKGLPAHGENPGVKGKDAVAVTSVRPTVIITPARWSWVYWSSAVFITFFAWMLVFAILGFPTRNVCELSSFQLTTDDVSSASQTSAEEKPETRFSFVSWFMIFGTPSNESETAPESEEGGVAWPGDESLIKVRPLSQLGRLETPQENGNPFGTNVAESSETEMDGQDLLSMLFPLRSVVETKQRDSKTDDDKDDEINNQIGQFIKSLTEGVAQDSESEKDEAAISESQLNEISKLALVEARQVAQDSPADSSTPSTTSAPVDFQDPAKLLEQLVSMALKGAEVGSEPLVLPKISLSDVEVSLDVLTATERVLYVSGPDDEKLNWLEALQSCWARKMQLVAIDSEEKNEEIIAFLNSSSTVHPDDEFWTAGTNLWVSDKTEFHWATTGKKFNFTYWHADNPSSAFAQDQNCVQLAKNLASKTQGTWRWNDYGCYSKTRFICETL